MAYQVLYRRFRPQTFDEIVGQDHIVPVLKNEIKTGKISHAYLFSGPRGTGKTSAAKVFARAVNCLDPVDGEACGKCASCLAEAGDAISNIIEIDAASNRGIDEIRQLKENVNFLPSNARYRVYIIDEVHMLTTEAFNALLKTLEEPPAHIIFIFATTEVHKILPTILSRCQRFDFRRVSDEAIVGRLSYVLDEVGVPYDTEALRIIAGEADGGLRDALSLTDKILSSEDSSVTSENVERILGIMGQDIIFSICEAVTSSDPSKAFNALNDAFESGADSDYIIDALTEYFRSLMIYTNVSEPKDMLFKSREYFESLGRSAVHVSNELLTSYMTEMGKLRLDSRNITNTRYLIETAVLRLCDRERLTDYLELTRRVEILEERIEGIIRDGVKVSAAPVQTASAAPAAEVRQTETKPAPVKESPAPDTVSDADTLAKMHEALRFASKVLMNRGKDIMMSGIVEDLRVASFSGDTLYVYPTGASVHMMNAYEKGNGRAKLEAVLAENLGFHVNVEVTSEPKSKPAAKKPAVKKASPEPAPAPKAAAEEFIPPPTLNDIPPEMNDISAFDPGPVPEINKENDTSLIESAMAIFGDMTEVE